MNRSLVVGSQSKGSPSELAGPGFISGYLKLKFISIAERFYESTQTKQSDLDLDLILLAD